MPKSSHSAQLHGGRVGMIEWRQGRRHSRGASSRLRDHSGGFLLGLARRSVCARQALLKCLSVADGVKVGMSLGLLCSESFLVIVAKEFVEEIDRFVGDETLVLRRDKAMPWLLLETSQNVIILGIQFNLVLVEVVKEVIGAENLGNFDQLVRITLTVEERLLAEDHRCEHGPQTPHVEAVVIFLKVYQQLWSFEVARRNTDIVFSPGVVELGQAPVDEA